MRLLRFRHGDRIATGVIIEGDTIQVLAGTFFEDPLPTGEEVALADVLLLALEQLGEDRVTHRAGLVQFGGAPEPQESGFQSLVPLRLEVRVHHDDAAVVP